MSVEAQKYVAQKTDESQFPLLCGAPLFGRTTQQAAETMNNCFKAGGERFLHPLAFVVRSECRMAFSKPCSHVFLRRAASLAISHFLILLCYVAACSSPQRTTTF